MTFGGPVPAGDSEVHVIRGTPIGAGSLTQAAVSGVDGYDWVVDQYGEVPPTLLALDDRGNVARSVQLAVSPQSRVEALVPTGKGLRAVLSIPGEGLQVRRADGTLLAQLPQLYQVRGAVGRGNGAILLAGWPADQESWAWGRSLVSIGADGTATFVDVPGAGEDGTVAPQPLVNVRSGTVLSQYGYGSRDISLLTGRGRIVRRSLKSLPVEWSPDCYRANGQIALEWATAGSAGDLVVGVSCVTSGDRVEETLETFMVGLDSRLRARWVAPGSQRPRIGRDGRLHYVLDGDDAANPKDVDAMVALREPGAGQPRRGRVVSVRRSGKGAIVAIRCAAPDGSVCAGTVQLSRGGSRTVKLRYALDGRPGRSAQIFRRFGKLPSGPSKVRATLVR